MIIITGYSLSTTKLFYFLWLAYYSWKNIKLLSDSYIALFHLDRLKEISPDWEHYTSIPVFIYQYVIIVIMTAISTVVVFMLIKGSPKAPKVILIYTLAGLAYETSLLLIKDFAPLLRELKWIDLGLWTFPLLISYSLYKDSKPKPMDPEPAVESHN